MTATENNLRDISKRANLFSTMKLHNNEVDGKEDVTPTYKLALLVTQTKRIVKSFRVENEN